MEVMHLRSYPFKTPNLMLLKRREKQKSVDAKNKRPIVHSELKTYVRLISRSQTSWWPQTEACTCARYHYHAHTSMQGYIRMVLLRDRKTTCACVTNSYNPMKSPCTVGKLPPYPDLNWQPTAPAHKNSQKETKMCHGWRWHCWFHQCCHNGCFFGTT